MTGCKVELYRDLLLDVRGISEGLHDPVANAANVAALLMHGLDGVRWAGFYFLKNGELVLGPFQGKSASGRLGLGEGACGRAAATGKTVLAGDGTQIAVPLIQNGVGTGVLLLESGKPARFDGEDAAGLEAVAQAFVAASF